MAIDAERQREVLKYYERALQGHVYIRETVDTFLDVLGRRIQTFPQQPCVLELGSHGGVVTSWLFERWPQISVLVSDDDDALVEMSRSRHAARSVAYVSGALTAIDRRVDLVVSVARHHHLRHDYLSELRQIMGPQTIYVLADELCPEYCLGPYAARIERADLLHVLGGHLLTTHEELLMFKETGTIPPAAIQLEDLRRRALWRWYRYVVDEAIDRGYFDIAVGELQSTHDDLITGSDAEHKFSPLIVEKQFALAGFELLSKRSIGPRADTSRQSMFVYEFRLAASDASRR